MATSVKQRILDVLEGIKFPGMSRDIVSFGFVDSIEETADGARVSLAITTHSRELAEQVRDEAREALSGLAGAGSIEVELKVLQPPSPAQQAVALDTNLIPEVQHVVAVASGKGAGESPPSRPISRCEWASWATAWACLTPTSTGRRYR